MIDSAAVGAGMCLATACDLRVGHRDAKMGFTFSKLGLHPGMAATHFVSQVNGFPTKVKRGMVTECGEKRVKGFLTFTSDHHTSSASLSAVGHRPSDGNADASHWRGKGEGEGDRERVCVGEGLAQRFLHKAN